MRTFTKPEKISLLIIFAVLIGISIPNFALSLRRARDQVRRDDMGALQHALDQYSADFGEFPPASADGRIMDCTKSGSKVSIDSKGRLVVDLIACEWGKDKFVNLTPGSNNVYMQILPRDPDYQKGAAYLYYSDGARYQIFARMEGGQSEAEYNPQIVARDLMCGTEVCNVGRSYNVPINISIEEYDKQLEQGK